VERKPRKKRIEAEAALVSAYVQWAYPDDYAIFRVSLGRIETKTPVEELEPGELELLGRYRRWADAIVIKPEKLILIEGAIRPALGDVSTILGYSRLIPLTPELEPYKELPRQLELVGAIYDPVVDLLCRESGIRYIQFTTTEVEQYLKQIPYRHRQPPRPSGLV